MGTPLPTWGPPLQNGDLPQDGDTTFFVCSQHWGGRCCQHPGWGQVGWPGRVRVWRDTQCPLCWGGALTLSPPAAAKSLLNKKADGVKVRGQRGRGGPGWAAAPTMPLSPFHLSPPAPDQQHQRQCRCHQPQGDPPAHRSGRCPVPCTPQIPHPTGSIPPAHPIHHHARPLTGSSWGRWGGGCPKDGKGCAGHGRRVTPLDRQGG